MANGRFILGKQSGGTLGLVFPDGVSNTEVVLPESGELATKNYADLKVALASFVGTNQSLAINGYQKLPGGLIIQWGKVTNNGTYTFPLVFPTACQSMAFSRAQGVEGVPGVDSFSPVGFFYRPLFVANTSAHYIAIGY